MEVGGFVILVLPVGDNYLISLAVIALFFQTSGVPSLDGFRSHWEVTAGPLETQFLCLERYSRG